MGTLPIVDLLLVVLIMALWGGNFPVAKVALNEMPALWFTTIRLALVGVGQTPFVPIPRGQFARLLFLSVTLGVGHYTLIYLAIARLDAATTVVLLQLTAPFGALIGLLNFGERIKSLQVIGMGVSFVGVITVVGGIDMNSDPWGVVFAIVSAAFWAIASSQAKKLSDVPGTTINAWVSLFAAPQLLIASLLLETGQIESLGRLSIGAWLSLLYCAIIAGALAWILWYNQLKKHPVNSLVPFLLLIPIFGILGSNAVLGEALTPRLIGGAILTMSGSFAIQLGPRIQAKLRRS